MDNDNFTAQMQEFAGMIALETLEILLVHFACINMQKYKLIFPTILRSQAGNRKISKHDFFY